MLLAMRWIALSAIAALVLFACSHLEDDYLEWSEQQNQGGTGGTGGTAGSGGQVGGQGGTGGTDPCGGCGGSTPYCDAVNGTCEACLEHEHCTEATAAQCDAGSCVPCTDNPHCAGVADAGICDSGTCVECTIDDNTCIGTDTCDLTTGACVDVPADSVGNCEACTNDDQCEANYRCISMDFPVNTPHGHYCLQEAVNCVRPFDTYLNRQSINGADLTDYCGIPEDIATCEAVNALIAGWVCTQDGHCSETEGGTEFPVPGALCRQTGGGPLDCSYECGIANHCPNGVSCGQGTGGAPSWCGG
ncbi:MAG: hypothetical protein DRI90_11130 [Deltaproteobacteria bacterium]|nr:MAG: hypothetical protein DRI90_11130 [Deltaproteobacteria bacterium]